MLHKLLNPILRVVISSWCTEVMVFLFFIISNDNIQLFLFLKRRMQIKL